METREDEREGYKKEREQEEPIGQGQNIRQLSVIARERQRESFSRGLSDASTAC